MQENQNNTQNQQNTQTEAVEQSINSTANVAEDAKVTEQSVFQGYRTKRVDGLIPFNKRSVIIM